MSYVICAHAFRRMADHDIYPGECDTVIDDPDWSGERLDGNTVMGKGGLAVVVKDKVIITAYRLEKREEEVVC